MFLGSITIFLGFSHGFPMVPEDYPMDIHFLGYGNATKHSQLLRCPCKGSLKTFRFSRCAVRICACDAGAAILRGSPEPSIWFLSLETSKQIMGKPWENHRKMVV